MGDAIRIEERGMLGIITLNRAHKRNAFDDTMLRSLQHAVHQVRDNPLIRIIILNANGRDFSAGADATWMQRIAKLNTAENVEDAMVLANLLSTLHTCPKPTIAIVQGAAFGGGAGLVAACDIAIGAHDARFCFSEVKLGLIPAVISPYVIKAIGERAAMALFLSAEVLTAERATQLQLLHHCVAPDALESFAMDYALRLTQLAPNAVREAKALVRCVAGSTIDETLKLKTAEWIAKRRASKEAKHGLQAFLNKETPDWNKEYDV